MSKEYRLRVTSPDGVSADVTYLRTLSRRRVLRGEDTLDAAFGMDEAAADLAVEGATLTVSDESLNNWEYRLTRPRRMLTVDDDRLVALQGRAVWMELIEGLVRQTLSAGAAPLYTFGLSGVSPEDVLADYILPGYEGYLVNGNPLDFQVGNVDASVAASTVSVQFDRTNPLAALRSLEEEARCEAQFRHSGSVIYVDLLERLGRVEDVAEIRYQKNLQGIERAEDDSGVATRVRAWGDGDLTLRNARWAIQGVTGLPNRWAFTSQAPIYEDDAFVGESFYVPRTSTAYPVLDSSATEQFVELDTTARPALEDGDIGYFSADSSTPIDYIESPTGIAAYGLRLAPPDAATWSNVPDAHNLLANPQFDEWDEDDFPLEWISSPGPDESGFDVIFPTLSEETDRQYIQNGASAARVVATGKEQGLLSLPFDLGADPQRPYTGFRVGLTIVSGLVLVQLVHSNGERYPLDQRHMVVSGDSTYLDIATVVHEEPLPAGTAQLLIESFGGAAEFVVDAAMVTLQANETVPTFIAGPGAELLWFRAAELLAEQKQARVEYIVDVADLYRIAPDTFPADELGLGDDVRVATPIAVEFVRIVDITEDLLRAEATELVLAPSLSRRLNDIFRPRWSRERSGLAKPALSTTRWPCAPPSDLMLANDTGTKDYGEVSRIIPRIRVTWLPSPGPAVDHYSLRWRRVGTMEWVQAADPARDDTLAYIVGIELLEEYEVELRAVNVHGTTSSAISDTIVAGWFVKETDLVLDNFDFGPISETEGRAWWNDGALVHEVWVRSQIFDKSDMPANPAAIVGALTDIEVVEAGTEQHTVTLPGPGQVLIALYAPVAEDLAVGSVEEARFDGPALANPSIDRITWAGGPFEFALAFRILDPANTGGTLSVWLPDSNVAAAADGTAAFSDTPQTIGPDTVFTGAVDLDEIDGRPDRHREVVVEFVTTDGRSTGQVRIVVPRTLEVLIDQFGKLKGGTVYNSFVLADTLRQTLSWQIVTDPDELAADAAGYAELSDYALTLLDSSGDPDPRRWHWSGSAWVETADQPVFGAYPILLAAMVRAVHIQIDALSELTDDAGVIVHGRLRNLLDTAGLHLDAVGNDQFLYHPNFELRADGSIDSPAFDVDSSGVVVIKGPLGGDAKLYVDGEIEALSVTVIGEINALDVTVTGRLDANEADIDNLEADVATIASAYIDAAYIDTLIVSGEIMGPEGGYLAVGGHIASSNHDPGVAGWAIEGNGDAEFNDGVFRGTLDNAGGAFYGTTVTVGREASPEVDYAELTAGGLTFYSPADPSFNGGISFSSTTITVHSAYDIELDHGSGYAAFATTLSCTNLQYNGSPVFVDGSGFLKV